MSKYEVVILDSLGKAGHGIVERVVGHLHCEDAPYTGK